MEVGLEWGVHGLEWDCSGGWRSVGGFKPILAIKENRFSDQSNLKEGWKHISAIKVSFKTGLNPIYQ